MKKDKRLITLRQEAALRLCHHNFGGLSQEEAAKEMGISRRAVNRLLNNAKKTAPQFFPILTKLQAKVYHCFIEEGWTVSEISSYTDLSETWIRHILQIVKKKGLPLINVKGKVLSYEQFGEDNGVDFFVKNKF